MSHWSLRRRTGTAATDRAPASLQRMPGPFSRGDEVLAGTLDHARAIARRSVLVADSGKFGRGSYVQVASHSAVPDVVSDDRLAPRWVAQIAESGTWLHAALVARSE